MTGWIVETLLGTSLLLLIVLLVREPVARTFGPRIAYLLWLAPALRMVLPPVPESWLPSAVAPVDDMVATMASAPAADVEATLMTVSTAPAAFAADPMVQSGYLLPSVDWPMTLLVVWLAGALLFFGWHSLAYWRFTRKVMRDAVTLDQRQSVEIAESASVGAPIAFGFARKMVVLPHNFRARFDALEQRLAIDHELAHHHRGDVRVNFVALAVLALFWWNPLAHFAHAAFRLDQEAACDDTVLDGATPDERSAYALALFKAATGGIPLAACTMAAKNQLKLRLRRIVRSQQGSVPVKAGLTLLAVLVPVGLIGTASNTVAAKAVAAVEAVDPLTSADPSEPIDTADVVDTASSEDIYRPMVEDAERRARDAEIAANQALARANRPLRIGDDPEALADAQEAAREAEEAAREARLDAEEARREAQDMRREAAQAAAEAQREARLAKWEAQREADDAAREAQREAMEAAREAQREAIEAAREARREAAEAAREAEQEARDALKDTHASLRINWRTSVPRPAAAPTPPLPPAPPAAPSCPDEARKRSVVAATFAGADGRLVSIAACTDATVTTREGRAKMRREITAQLVQARKEVAVDPAIAANLKAQIIKGIDAQIGRMRAADTW